MSFRRQFEQGYASFWRSLANFMRNSSGFPLCGVARRGSRSTGQHKDKSDLDVIFAISGDPPKGEVYPLLVERLKRTLKINADIGSSYNVINIWKNQINCDLVLLTRSQFHAQIMAGYYEE